MATIYDLIEVTGIFENTTYSTNLGNVLGVVDGMASTALDDGEFDEGDFVTIGGTNYTIDLIQEPSNSGRFTLSDGTDVSFNPQSESNLDVIFLTVSNGPDVRYFIIPNDRFGDIAVEQIRTGSMNDVAGNDATIVSTTDNSVSVVCFACGTLIEGPDDRLTPIEKLRKGDPVKTLDGGVKPIAWIGVHSVSVSQIMSNPSLRPIIIRKGALGLDTPKRDLVVSQQRRILVRSKIAERMFGETEILVPAKQLIDVDGITLSDAFDSVDYYHFMFDHHEIVFANGALCESLFPGPQAMQALGDLVCHKAKYPDPDAQFQNLQPCRAFAAGPKARNLALRHKKNSRSLVTTPAAYSGDTNSKTV